MNDKVLELLNNKKYSEAALLVKFLPTWRAKPRNF